MTYLEPLHIHYVYCHFRNDTNALFYVGKGQNKRAYDRKSRNPYWKNTVQKAGGFTVKIIASNLTNTEALRFENILICAIKNQLNIKLCNLTDGGEGVLNPSEETRAKQRNAKLGKKLSEEHKINISIAGKGRKHSEETKAKLSLLKKGKPNPCKGMKRSEEAGKRISEAKKAKNMKHTDETKLKISLTKRAKRNI